MVIKTVTIHTCDRCGVESEHKNFHNGSQCGKASISIVGNHGAKSFAGDWGGTSYDYNSDLCFRCANVFIDMYHEFMKDELSS